MVKTLHKENKLEIHFMVNLRMPMVLVKCLRQQLQRQVLILMYIKAHVHQAQPQTQPSLTKGLQAKVESRRNA